MATTAGESRPRREERDGQTDRRALLRRLLGLGAVAWVGFPWSSPLGCSASEPTCYDPELLSTAEQSTRKLRGYVDRSPQAESRRCGGCAFFESSGEPADCGHCKILGGPVSAMGLCSAWAEKAAS